MKKEKAIKIITSCAKEYHENLEGRNLLFIYGTFKSPEYFEATFGSENFCHLTGMVRTQKFSAEQFYQRCLRGKLNPFHIDFRKNGTTEMKLRILPRLMTIDKTATMIGTYNNSKSFLVTDKLAGNVNACMGFITKGGHAYYMPNTALDEDIRAISVRPLKRVFAVLKKDIKDKKYTSLSYIARNVSLDDISMPEELSVLINSDVK